jgi:hypothetical protein
MYDLLKNKLFQTRAKPDQKQLNREGAKDAKVFNASDSKTKDLLPCVLSCFSLFLFFSQNLASKFFRFPLRVSLWWPFHYLGHCALAVRFFPVW